MTEQIIMPIGVAREITEELTAQGVKVALSSAFPVPENPDENCLAWAVEETSYPAFLYRLGLLMGCDNYDIQWIAAFDTPIRINTSRMDLVGFIAYWPWIHVDHNQE